jgi:hypothetical protein
MIPGLRQVCEHVKGPHARLRAVAVAVTVAVAVAAEEAGLVYADTPCALSVEPAPATVGRGRVHRVADGCALVPSRGLLLSQELI